MRIVEYRYKNYRLLYYTAFKYLLDELYVDNKRILSMNFSTRTLESKSQLYEIKPTNKRLSFYLALSNEKVIIDDEVLQLLEKRWLTDNILYANAPSGWDINIVSIK